MKNRPVSSRKTRGYDPCWFYAVGLLCCFVSAVICACAAWSSWREAAPFVALLGGAEAVIAAFGTGIIAGGLRHRARRNRAEREK